MKKNKNLKLILSLVAAAILFVVFFFFNPLSISNQASQVLAVGLVMLTLWFTETLPVGWVSLLPLIAFPLLGVMDIKHAAANYIDKMVWLFFGGFVLGFGIEKWNLHKRIALGIVNLTGTSPNKIILGFTISVGFLSMWLSNTATTMMMFPIALSVVHLVENNYSGKGKVANFSLVLMMMIAFASNIGGMATIIGTPPNIVMRGIVESRFGLEVSFFDWMIFAFPVSLILLISAYFSLVYFLYPNRMDKNSIPVQLIRDEYNKLGKMSRNEWAVAIIFLMTSLCWIFRSPLNDLIGALKQLYFSSHYPDDDVFLQFLYKFKLEDHHIGVLGAITMMLVPARSEKFTMLVNPMDLKKIKWGILLLFGGGLCLATALDKSGLMKMIGDGLAGNGDRSMLLMVFLLTGAAIYITEVMSNVALVNVFIPVVCAIAVSMNVNPLYFAIPVTLGASCAFMLPMGTPPNAIVFASGKIRLYQMASAGFILNIIATLLISLTSYYFLKFIF